jgi:hypothetical protein
MKTQLKYIEEIITNYSAVKYAEIMLEKEKENFTLLEYNTQIGKTKETKPSYYEYMKQMWHWKDNPPIEECVEASRLSKLNKYAEMVQMYSGWIKNGRLFVLNKKEGFVSFLYKLEKEGYTLNSKIRTVVIRTNYNPKGVDCIEDNINPKYFSEMISDEHYDISKNEKELNDLCDQLCAVGKF